MSKKYRPYLSLPMMERIAALCSLDTRTTRQTSLDIEIHDAMSIMILKARHEITKPSYIPIPDKLGMSTPASELTGSEYRFSKGLMSPSEELEYAAELMNKLGEPNP